MRMRNISICRWILRVPASNVTVFGEISGSKLWNLTIQIVIVQIRPDIWWNLRFYPQYIFSFYCMLAIAMSLFLLVITCNSVFSYSLSLTQSPDTFIYDGVSTKICSYRLLGRHCSDNKICLSELMLLLWHHMLLSTAPHAFSLLSHVFNLVSHALTTDHVLAPPGLTNCLLHVLTTTTSCVYSLHMLLLPSCWYLVACLYFDIICMWTNIHQCTTRGWHQI